ncbi:MAG: hypothetical protein HY898_23365 [Deltaproteobacteria bacterium]|nr:hypothetical protein [Deltaproteobacteria bacterium]
MRRELILLAVIAAAVAACSDDSSTPWTPQDGGGVGGSDAASAGGSSQGGSSAGGSATGGSGTGGSAGSADPYEQYRQECIDKINALRATKGLGPYTRWKSAEPCVDQQATDDEKNNSPHGAWSSKKFPCDGYGSGQNECLGSGAAGISGCLESMWAEKDQAGCSGCDQCPSPGGNCPNCDFYGKTTGDVCGHYVNMSAKTFSMAACGFSSLGGWAAINFQ